MLIFWQKHNFIIHILLEILHRYCQLVILGTLSMPGYRHSKWYYQLEENFCIYLHTKKSTSSPTFFWKYCKDNANFLFWVLWACLAVDTKIDSISQNDTINLRKTLMFTYMPKINFIIHFFLRYYIKRILQFDWPAAFLLITQEPEFFQICDW